MDASGNWTLALAQQTETTQDGKIKDDLGPIPPTPIIYYTFFLPSYHHFVIPMKKEHSVGGKQYWRNQFLIILF